MRLLTNLLIILACIGFILLFPGCDSGGSSRSSSPSYGGGGGGGTGTGTGTGGGGGGNGTPGSNDANTGMSAPKDMFSHVNAMRQRYAQHGGYGDYPWEAGSGNGMQNIIPWTWPVSMQWDDGLAAEAQGLADGIASSGQPFGREFEYQNNSSKESFWADGLDTAKYRICARSYADNGEERRWFDTGNGTAREGLYYQTGMAKTAHDVKTKLGVGKADIDANDVWWVLIFGE